MPVSNNKKINITFSTDENYAKYCIVAITSIKETQKDFDEINIFVLVKNLSEKTQKQFENLNTENFKIKLIDISNIDVNNFQEINSSEARILPASTYYRLLIANILKDCDKALYLDCDIIVKGSLLPLWEKDLSEYYFAAVKDVNSERILKETKAPDRKQAYFNSGVLLMNLKKWREQNGLEKCKSFVRKPYVEPKFHDQDILNFSFEDDEILFIEDKWNFHYVKYNPEIKYAVIIHYIWKKPWLAQEFNPYRKYYWDIVKKTIWKNEKFIYYPMNFLLKIFPIYKIIKELNRFIKKIQ